MKPTPRTLLCVAAMAAACFQATAVLAQETSKPALAGQKLDSGLGELPHYRHWADPTGKDPMAGTLVGQKIAGQKLDSGLGDLPHYRYWADPSAKQPLRTEQVVAESSARR
jgi:hypothetical protein